MLLIHVVLFAEGLFLVFKALDEARRVVTGFRIGYSNNILANLSPLHQCEEIQCNRRKEKNIPHSSK